MPKIADAKILIMATDGFEQSELEHPRDALSEKGAEVHIATPDGSAIKGWDEDNWGDEVRADLSIADVKFSDYDALVLPGGQINPDILRLNENALKLITGFVGAAKPVAAICHAPWLLIEAGLAEGREMTSYTSIKTDLINAGANWVDKSVAYGEGIITSRNPDDLPDFVARIVTEIEKDQSVADAA